MMYLAEHLSAPDRLDDLFPQMTREIARRRHSRFTLGQRTAALLSGTAMPDCFAARVRKIFPEFPDAASVGRGADDIQNYISRLIAPDTLEDARPVLWEALLIDEDVDVVAGDLARLSAISPKAATALLELRIGRGYAILTDNISDFSFSQDQRDALRELMLPVATTMARIRIGYLLRGVAMKCAAQMYAPLNWETLDNAEQDKSGGPLFNATLIRKVEADLVLADILLAAYRPGLTKDSFVELEKKTKTKTKRALKRLGLDDRGRVQRGLWQRQHGDMLIADLDHQIERVLPILPIMQQGLADHRASYSLNSLVGHLGRAKAGVRLYLAVEEAIDWIIDPVDNRREDSTSAPPRPIEPWLATTLQALAVSGSNALKAPPRVHEKATTVDHLFAALRIAFLHDNGLYRIQGSVVHRSPKNEPHYKARNKVSHKAGQLPGFKESYVAYMSRPGWMDNEIKREAVTARTNVGTALRGTFVDQRQLRTSIFLGFKAA